MGFLGPGEREARQSPVEENIRVQYFHWRFERIGFWVLLTLMALAVLGLFSQGIFSHVRAQTVSGSLAVEYQRFLRNGATSTLVLSLHGKPDELSRVLINEALLGGFTVESIVPPPQASATHEGGGMELLVRPDTKGQTRIYLALRSNGVGILRSRVSAHGEDLSFHQFIYP